ncbi:unnamed protein product [Peniophora sp. CBMAI 1063]|nr:unnamed protein product [Peniophora sp. CBMAI 1063]
MPDVEMKADDASKTETAEEKKEVTPALTPVAEIKANASLIERAVATLEPRFTHRVLRTLTALRKRLDDKALKDAVTEVYPKESATKSALLALIPTSSEGSMDIDAPSIAPASKPPTSDPVPEVEVYLRLLVIHHLLKSESGYAKAKELANETISVIQRLNRRTMDPISAKVWYAVERTYELAGELDAARPLFLAAQRTASLRHDDETQASLINRLLRSYTLSNLYDQADKLVSKTTFPPSASNAQYARFHYYLGRIKAVKLDYTVAHTNLQQAIRRAPQARVAPGFWQAVHKLFIVVELLMGDIPDRGLFRHPVLEKALGPYFDIVKAVRTGSLAEFQSTLAAHASSFEADKTYTLIARLRQNVIKTGIRRLSLSYARISLRDICVKLHLDSEEDAEYIVGKAIRDGVIEGRILHEKGWMECQGLKSSYGPEVSEMFSKRIGYCLELHNESVKAMRYPMNAHRKELADAEDAREREKELVKEIAEGELDEDDGLGGPGPEF